MTVTATKTGFTYKAEKLNGIKFAHPDGYTLGSGWGVLEVETGRWYSGEGKLHPFEWKVKSIAVDIAEQFNVIGVCGKLHYNVSLS